MYYFGRVDCVRNYPALRAGMRMGSRLDGVTAGRHQFVSVCVLMLINDWMWMKMCMRM